MSNKQLHTADLSKSVGSDFSQQTLKYLKLLLSEPKKGKIKCNQ